MANIKQLIEKALERKRGNSNEINLGCMNGWNQETNDLYDFLSEQCIPDSYSETNLGRCYNQYRFDILLMDDHYSVVYTVDSGD